MTSQCSHRGTHGGLVTVRGGSLPDGPVGLLARGDQSRPVAAGGECRLQDFEGQVAGDLAVKHSPQTVRDGDQPVAHHDLILIEVAPALVGGRSAYKNAGHHSSFLQRLCRGLSAGLLYVQGRGGSSLDEGPAAGGRFGFDLALPSVEDGAVGIVEEGGDLGHADASASQQGDLASASQLIS